MKNLIGKTTIVFAIDGEKTAQLKSFCEQVDDISKKIDDLRRENSSNGKSSNFDSSNVGLQSLNPESKNEEEDFKPSLVLFDQNGEDLTAWTQNTCGPTRILSSALGEIT